MPIYEYRCGKCGVFEVMQRITDASLKKCPTCKGKVEKIVSRSSFVLKGSGWYATDYPKKGEAENKKADEGEPAATAANGKSDASTDSPAKPEPKPASESKSSPSKAASGKKSTSKSAD